MINEENFKFNIDNIKNDLEMEGMYITEEDVQLFRRYANKEINMPELINIIKSKPLGEI